MNSLLEGDKAKCASIVAHLLEQKIDIKVLYKDLFQRSLYQIGKQWENNKSCVGSVINRSSGYRKMGWCECLAPGISSSIKDSGEQSSFLCNGMTE